MNLTPYARFLPFLALLLLAPAASADDGWVQIDVSAPFVDRNGVERRPSCSGGPLPPATPFDPPMAANTDYSFFFRPGNPHELAIFWDGGGACWDGNTCIGTALQGTPIYNLTVDETTASLAAADGLGDFANPENPIADYTQVFIPYCSGDLHTGSRDTTYAFSSPFGGPPLLWPIRHRGYDNVAAVLHWLTNHYENEVGFAPSRVFLSGASAGGYGVLYAYPSVDALLPSRTRIRVLVDAANGVINQDFFERALTPAGAWGVWENLAPELMGAFASGPDNLVVETFKALGSKFPLSRFGQYTTAFDETQILFYNIARHVQSPGLWFNAGELAVSGLDWTIRARTYMIFTALQTWNYRFYLAKGTDHTVIVSDKYYLEDSARGLALVDWVDDMIHRFWPFGGDWRNVTCTPDCLP